jgi:hypothetical protein
MTRSLRVRRLWCVPQAFVKVPEGDPILEVHAQENFGEKLPAARLAQALAELICNGLDAEPTKSPLKLIAAN